MSESVRGRRERWYVNGELRGDRGADEGTSSSGGDEVSFRSAYDYDMNEWFELSYASFLTVPRVVMEHMPLEWQQQMARLLQEMDDTFDWRPPEGRYWVRLRDRNGRFAEAPLGEYRHRNVEHLRWSK